MGLLGLLAGCDTGPTPEQREAAEVLSKIAAVRDLPREDLEARQTALDALAALRPTGPAKVAHERCLPTLIKQQEGERGLAKAAEAMKTPEGKTMETFVVLTEAESKLEAARDEWGSCENAMTQLRTDLRL